MLKHIGTVTPVPGGLVAVGPLVQVQISHHLMAPPTVPIAPIPVKMMIDTGAERTVIEKRLAGQLGLTPIRFQPMVGVSQKAEMCPVYLMSVTLLVGQGAITNAVTFATEVIGMSSPLIPQQHVGLLGRDFLQHMKLVYDGPRGLFELIPEMPAATAPAMPAPASDKAKTKAKRKEARRARKRNRRR